jgi:hypothetical protein
MFDLAKDMGNNVKWFIDKEFRTDPKKARLHDIYITLNNPDVKTPSSYLIPQLTQEEILTMCERFELHL